MRIQNKFLAVWVMPEISDELHQIAANNGGNISIHLRRAIEGYIHEKKQERSEIAPAQTAERAERATAERA